MTTTIVRAARRGAATLMLLMTGACASGSGGQISDILGSVLGGGAATQGANQVSGTVRGVDTQARQIGLQLSNGQTVGIGYDDQTKVVYNNQSYAVSSLDPGDQVTARVQSTQGGAYYTDVVQVDQPVQNTNGGATGTGTTTGSGNVQSFQGTVRQIDATNGLFSLASGNSTVTVSLPYNVTRADQDRFQRLRAGDTVRLYGVWLNNTRVELRQFY
jgi:Cu/Ag efflux protein CusF